MRPEREVARLVADIGDAEQVSNGIGDDVLERGTHVDDVGVPPSATRDSPNRGLSGVLTRRKPIGMVRTSVVATLTMVSIGYGNVNWIPGARSPTARPKRSTTPCSLRSTSQTLVNSTYETVTTAIQTMVNRRTLTALCTRSRILDTRLEDMPLPLA